MDIFGYPTGNDPELNPLLQPPAQTSDILEQHPQLAAVAMDVQRVRDVVAGSRRIKSLDTVYLPRSRPGVSDEEYQAVKEHTVFFPATARTAEGKKGLMFAKNVVLDCPALEPIKEVITRELGSIREMAEQVVEETLQTNFTGLLIDHPDAPAGQIPNARDAIEQGFRPYIHVYPYESIRWIEYYAAGGTTRLPRRVVLRQSLNVVLELMIVDGVYVQREWTATNGSGFTPARISTPIRDGKTLNRIPFVIVSDNRKAWPQPSALRDIAELNLDHYKANSRIANLALYGSAVVPVITGITLNRDEDNQPKAPDITFTTGGFLALEEATATATYMEPKGNMAKELAAQALEISQMMAKAGSRILASDKAAPENENVVAMRNLGEDSATASTAMTYASRIAEALGWCAWWMGGEQKAGFTLNTDYGNAKLDAPTIIALTAAVQNGLLDWQNFYYALRDGGIINRLDTPDAAKARIDQDIADRPPVDGLPLGDA